MCRTVKISWETAFHLGTTIGGPCLQKGSGGVRKGDTCLLDDSDSAEEFRSGGK